MSNSAKIITQAVSEMIAESGNGYEMIQKLEEECGVEFLKDNVSIYKNYEVKLPEIKVVGFDYQPKQRKGSSTKSTSAIDVKRRRKKNKNKKTHRK